jgi:hypothetical protein
MVEDLYKRMETPQMKSINEATLDRWDVPMFERRDEEPTPL